MKKSARVDAIAVDPVDDARRPGGESDDDAGMTSFMASVIQHRHIPCGHDLLERERLRRNALARPVLENLAPIVAARISSEGLELGFEVPTEGDLFAHSALGLDRVSTLASVARAWACLHDVGLGLLDAPDRQSVAEAVWVGLDGQVTLIGWSPTGALHEETAAFSEWALDHLPHGSVEAQAVSALLQGADGPAPSMAAVSVALAQAARRGGRSAQSPVADRRVPSRLEPHIATATTPGRHRRSGRSQRRRWLLSIAAVGVVGVVAVTGWPSVAGESVPTTPLPVCAPTPTS
jgi:hypothetical protein